MMRKESWMLVGILCVVFVPLQVGTQETQWKKHMAAATKTECVAEIIKQRYGFPYTRFPFKYMDEFRRYQREAREQNRGLGGRVRR